MAVDELNPGMVRIDPSSPLYQEVARLYRLAHQLRPGAKSLWNGELYARGDDKWGSLGRDGALRLNRRLVLDQLTGGASSQDPRLQGQALVTVLHEALHARVDTDAAHEPNAVRDRQSIGLDEGLTEITSIEAYDEFARRAGYDGVPKPAPEYAGAVHAADAVVRHATSSPSERNELLTRALDQPVVMRWNAISDHIVRAQLANVVPADAAHQRAARAHLVNQMAVPEWAVVQNRPLMGAETAEKTIARLDQAVADIEAHYHQQPGAPFPAKVPNPAAAMVAPGLGEAQQGRSLQLDLEVGQRILSASAPASGATQMHLAPGQGAQSVTRGGAGPQVHRAR